MKTKLLLIFLMLFQLKMSAQNCTYMQIVDTSANSVTFIATDTTNSYNYFFVADSINVLNNLTGGHSATYQGFLNDTLPHEICMKIVDLLNQVVICESCTIFQLGATTPPPNPSCAFTYYFSNDTLYASQTGSITPADYVWNVNGNFYNGTQLILYVGNIDSIQVDLNGQNVALGTSCFNTMYNNHCNDTICKTITVSNSPMNDTCSALFIFTQIQTYTIGAINLASGINPMFSWHFGDGPQSIFNGPYPSYTYMNAGTYEVCLTLTTDSCTATYCDSLTVDSAGIMRGGGSLGFTINVLSPLQATGLNTAETFLNTNSSINIYPNPSTGAFMISATANIEVYNLIGDLVLTENSATSIDLTAAPKGMYFVKLNGGKIEKLIKN